MADASMLDLWKSILSSTYATPYGGSQRMARIFFSPTTLAMNAALSNIPPLANPGVYVWNCNTNSSAFWLNNAYVPADDKLGGMTWMMDLLPACPLYVAIMYVWAYARAEFTRDQYVDRADPDLIRLRPFKTNLHWSLRYIPYTRSEWSISTPRITLSDCRQLRSTDISNGYIDTESIF
jgi:hypothetical protein